MAEKLSTFRIERREALYKAVLKVLARAGYKHARIEDVALEADMSKGNIYFYAADKEELFYNAVDWILNQWHQAITVPAPQAVTARARLNAMSQNSFKFLHDHKELVQILKNNPTILSLDSKSDHYSAVSSKARAQVRSAVEDGIASGEFKASLDIEATTEFLFTTQLLYLAESFVLDDARAHKFFTTGIEITLDGVSAR